MELDKVEVKSKFKSKGFWLTVVAALVFGIIFYSIGVSSAKVTLEEKKVDYNQLVKAIEGKEGSLASIKEDIRQAESDLTAVQGEIKEQESAYAEAKKVIENRSALEAEVAKIQSDLGAKQTEIQNLENTIESKKGELAGIEGQIREKKEAPKQLPAGHFVVGRDIAEGRYKVVPVGEGSNFVVYSAGGELKVNTILGSWGVKEYVFFASEGDEIQSEAPTRFVPVE
ncbi:hypothetical protein [Bacillus sp. T33-2]|uniref:hypothetical protein n=1 Tax=Bacillus sp. T33-2 TaxID=2054168 RepID=UPI000C767239|nr:hypothetical protein [Bacillus sp. T33-2]PLR95901.1 hypothetical protein CVD19_12810 [Bacillus sp. T33-2]